MFLVKYKETAWGWLGIVATKSGLAVTTLPFADKKRAVDEVEKYLPKEATLIDSLGKDGKFTDEELARFELQLEEYFSGKPMEFDVTIDWDSIPYPPFRRLALEHLSSIGYGQVTTYGQIARAIGKPRSARAVGGAMHNNHHPLVLPCHRVLGVNGRLTGFGGGLALKRRLLELEGIAYYAPKD